jgi:hypothetical protein
MRRVFVLTPFVLLFACGTLPAQDAVPGFAPSTSATRVTPPITLPTAFNMQPVDPGVPTMVPPVAPPGYTPIPRGDLTQPGPFDRLLTNPFAQATEAGGQAARTFNENFDGDFAGVYYSRRIVTGFTVVPVVVGFNQTVVGFTQTPGPITTTTTTTTTTTIGPPATNGAPTVIVTNNTTNTSTSTVTNTPVVATTPIVVNQMVAQERVARLLLAARYSGVLITDNDNPRPQDRVYGGFNYYDHIGASLNPGLGAVNYQRQMGGFEKTFLGGDASFGMRLPVVQQYGPQGVGGTHNVGDLSLIWKYAIINNRQTGDLWSAGLVLTTPTGSGTATLLDGTTAPHSVLFQPWTGVVRVFDRAYVQGITSLVVPSDHRDPTLWNNSLAAGYYLYRTTADRWLTAIVPTAEVHVRTPLNDRNPAGLVFLQDQVNFTGGVHFRFNRAVLSAAVNVPVVGPRPWGTEAMAFFNFYF